MQHVVLARLEVARPAGTVLEVAEVGEPAVGEEPRRVGDFVDRWPAHIPEAESRDELRPGAEFAGVLVGHSEHDRVGDPEPRGVRIRQSAAIEHRHEGEDPIRIHRVVPEEELVRRAAEIVGFAPGRGQAAPGVDLVALEKTLGPRAGVPDEDLDLASAGGGVEDRAELAVVEPLVSDHLRRNLAHLDRWVRFRVRLDPEDVDRMGRPRSIPVTDVEALSGDPEPARVARPIQVAAAPGTRGGILPGRNREDPVDMLEVAE